MITLFIIRKPNRCLNSSKEELEIEFIRIFTRNKKIFRVVGSLNYVNYIVELKDVFKLALFGPVNQISNKREVNLSDFCFYRRNEFFIKTEDDANSCLKQLINKAESLEFGEEFQVRIIKRK